MQLDQTNVVVRARSLSEIGDLAMIIIRQYPAASILAFAVGMLPWVVLNTLLIGWIPVVEYREGFYDDEMQSELARYIFLMITLVTLQAPIAGVITTSLIGRAVFESQVTWRSALSDLRQTFWRWFWVLGIVRGPLPLVIILATNWGEEFAVGRELLMPMLFLLLVCVQRGRRPFMPEILLLERCPLRSKAPTVITVSQRNAALHGPMLGELVGRFLSVTMILGIFFFAAFFSLMWVRELFLGRSDWTMMVHLVFIPAALWAVAALSVLIRFLSYLDTRIRLEGWEVDLALRAEAHRQFGDTPPRGVSPPPGPAKRRTLTPVATVFIAAMLLQPAPSVAAESDAAVPPVPSTNWYDAKNQQLRPVQVRTELPDSKNRDSRWLPQASKLRAQNASGGSTVGSSTLRQALGWILLAVIAAILITVVVYVFRKAEPGAWASPAVRANGREGPDAQTLQRMQHLPAEVRRTDVDPRDEAERLMRAGQFDQAIILLYAHQLLLLDRGGLLRLARGKTNGRYLRETRGNSADAHRYLKGTVRAFEASYFGRHHPDAQQMQQLWTDNTTLESVVHAKLGAAA